MTKMEKLMNNMQMEIKTAQDMLAVMNVKDLRSAATANGIKNYKQYKKEELITKLAEVIAQRIMDKYQPEIEELQKANKEEADDKPQLNRHQKLALNKVKAAYGWIVGGYENSVQDGELENMPSVERMFNEVYDMVMTEDVGEGFAGGISKTELRFAGKQFILDHIAALFRRDGYEVPEELTRVPEKKPSTGARKNIKGDPGLVGDDEVVMRAFTGMLIGIFKIHKQTNDTTSVKTQKGILEFDSVTGLQKDAKNPKFANRIER